MQGNDKTTLLNKVQCQLVTEQYIVYSPTVHSALFPWGVRRVHSHQPLLAQSIVQLVEWKYQIIWQINTTNT